MVVANLNKFTQGLHEILRSAKIASAGRLKCDYKASNGGGNHVTITRANIV